MRLLSALLTEMDGMELATGDCISSKQKSLSHVSHVCNQHSRQVKIHQLQDNAASSGSAHTKCMPACVIGKTRLAVLYCLPT